MTRPDPSAMRGDRHPRVPWWLGRGIGLSLLALVVAVGWTMSWGIAAEVGTGPPPVTRWWERDAATIGTVSSRPVTASPEAPVTASPEARVTASLETPVTASREAPHHDPPGGAPVTAAAPRDDEGPTDAGQEIDRGQQSSKPDDHSLREEVLEERRRERIRRARQADQDLAAFIESIGVLDVLSPWVAPLDGSYRITATFGQGGSLWSNDHTGVDLAAPAGTPVATVAAGTVTHAGEAGAYGLRVEVTHPDGTETSYSHLSRIDVTEGQVIGLGTSVGAVGSTGNSTGPHLHLELRPAGGDPVDPVQALLARGVAL